MNNKGVALLTVLLVMIIGLGLTAITTLLIVRGYQTSRAAKNYQIALQMAQGGIEEAIIDLETTSYVSAQNFINLNPQTGDPGDPNDFYEINEVFWKPLSGFGGVPVFPPVAGAYSAIPSIGVYYLIHAQATKGDSQADLYVLYVKGY
ncbi:membrane protein [Candidatus Desulfofervidus auxilii]|uniref:Membrane protein n=1 Tax=Desulfofervidus auxilii TaxID=1621989 RepID=A0A7V1I490_DESA2|nr:hypothetical protein [Candidatus Desulfofervidus auxilii]AMM39835.1 membrane protein [Candidatus Desulfofervidus auxilii]CAD7769022.1 hypothetical protein BLFGPEAP_00033 [Candidatus Methanoperedenaceae archaeon GB50]CAD7774671.1 MAG: hypothetical protein KIIPBIDF_00598 [Candidatus Methanoperedenaceae archaeon GB50]HEB74160.1 hypothetical protein [Candidatus Desulfofervidus auxilii]